MRVLTMKLKQVVVSLKQERYFLFLLIFFFFSFLMCCCKRQPSNLVPILSIYFPICSHHYHV